MTPYGYALVGLTAIVAVFVGVLAFAILRFAAAARDTRRNRRESGDRVFVNAALQQALEALKEKERAMSARATASEQLSDQIVASLTAGLLVVDAAGTVRILNPAGWRMLGLQPADPPGDYRTLLEHAAPLAAAITECLTTRQPIVRRAIQMGSPSRASHLGVTVSPLAANNGGQGAICLFSDLTSVVDLEEQLRLKDALARVGELTAGIAHEFRNGLATIHGYSRLMDPRALPPQYQPYVQGIRQEAEALGAVVTNFLNFARTDHVAFHPIELQPIVQRTAEELAHDVAERADIRVEGEFGTVDGDEVLLRQAFGNLLRNAVEACEGSGVSPVVRVAGEIDARQRVVRITVNDNGPGLDPSMADRVFRPFFTTKAQGTGLGLAIVQKIIVTHNGRVAIGRSPLGGASFRLTLPLSAA